MSKKITTLKKVTKKRKPKKNSRMKCFVVFIRSSRKSKWKQTKEVVTSFSEHFARLIAASKNRNKWVKVVIK